MTPGAGAVSWEWLAGCRSCGQSHEYRPDPQHPGFKTRAADDGHVYISRINPELLNKLMREYQAGDGQ